MSAEQTTQTAEQIEQELTIEGHSEWEHQVDPLVKATGAFFIGLLGSIILAWFLGKPLGTFMGNIQNTFLYHFIPFLISTSFVLVLVYKAYIQDIKGLGFLTSAIALHAIAEFLSMLSTPTGTILNRDGNTLAMFADLFFPLAIVMLYLHIALLDKSRPSLVHSIGIGGTAAPVIIGGLLLTLFENSSNQVIATVIEELRKVVFVYLGLFALIILWISIFAFRVMFDTLKHADSPSIALSSNLVLVAFSSMMTNFFLLGVNYSTTISQSIGTERGIILSGITIHTPWLVTFSLITILLAYILSPEFSYAVPFDVFQLVAIHKEIGVTLFSFVNEIRTDSKSSTHNALQSATIVAIQNLVQEIAAAEGNIMLIGMEDRIIVFRSKEELVTVLITERTSYFLSKGLEEFTDAFYAKFQKDIQMFSGNVGLFKEANDLIRNYMPFMRKDSLI